MHITAAVMLVLWITGFAAGYAVRSYRSHRRRKRARLDRIRTADAPVTRTLAPLESIDSREGERVRWMRTSPPSMVS